MKQEHAEILELLTDYLTKYPGLRFGQALFNLGINEFANPQDPEKENYTLRDIHADSDADILKRIKS